MVSETEAVTRGPAVSRSRVEESDHHVGADLGERARLVVTRRELTRVRLHDRVDRGGVDRGDEGVELGHAVEGRLDRHAPVGGGTHVTCRQRLGVRTFTCRTGALPEPAGHQSARTGRESGVEVRPRIGVVVGQRRGELRGVRHVLLDDEPLPAELPQLGKPRGERLGAMCALSDVRVGETHAHSEVGRGGAHSHRAPIGTDLARRPAPRIDPRRIERRVGPHPGIGLGERARQHPMEEEVLLGARRARALDRARDVVELAIEVGGCRALDVVVAVVVLGREALGEGHLPERLAQLGVVPQRIPIGIGRWGERHVCTLRRGSDIQTASPGA